MGDNKRSKSWTLRFINIKTTVIQNYIPICFHFAPYLISTHFYQNKGASRIVAFQLRLKWSAIYQTECHISNGVPYIAVQVEGWERILWSRHLAHLKSHILYVSGNFSTSKQEQNMTAIHSSGCMPSQYCSVYLCLKSSWISSPAYCYQFILISHLKHTCLTELFKFTEAVATPDLEVGFSRMPSCYTCPQDQNSPLHRVHVQ